MNKVILFGNSGFIGNYIQNNFKDYEVIGYNSLSCNLLDIENIYKIFNECLNPIDIIVTSCVVRTKENSVNSFEQNFLMIKNLSQAISNTNIQINHIIFLSSVDVYGPNTSDIIDENSLTNPKDFYSLSKLTNEFFLKMVCSSKNISLSILRLPGVYGDEESNSTLGKLIANARKGSITIYGDGKNERDFLYVMDLLKVLSVCIKENINDTINVVTGSSFSINEISQLILKYIKHTKIVYKEQQNDRSEKLSFNNSKLKLITGSHEMTTIIEYLNNLKEK